jgi:hypothetical protein
MTTAALITMITTMVIVTSFVSYFFLKMLRTPVKRNTGTGREDGTPHQ